jgi:hypothetical protein
MIQEVHPGSRIQISIFYASRIPGSKIHRIPDPQHCKSAMQAFTVILSAKTTWFILVRTRIRLTKMLWIHANPEPQHCFQKEKKFKKCEEIQDFCSKYCIFGPKNLDMAQCLSCRLLLYSLQEKSTDLLPHLGQVLIMASVKDPFIKVMPICYADLQTLHSTIVSQDSFWGSSWCGSGSDSSK